MKNFKPTPMIGLKRKIHSRFPIYNIDEFRTSVLSSKTHKKCTNLKLADKFGKPRKIHSILAYPMSGRLQCINRDYNAICNFKYLVSECLNGHRRPLAFRRDKDVEKECLTGKLSNKHKPDGLLDES
jgi:hypothetical protein